MGIGSFLALGLLLTTSVHAESNQSIARSYELFTGMSSCARSLTVEENGPVIMPSNITADGVSCSGGTLALGPVIPSPEDTLSSVLQTVADTAGIHLAILYDPLICGAFVVNAWTRVYTVSPSKSDVPLADAVLPEIGDLNLGQAFKFIQGQNYILFGTECMYMATESEVMTEEAMPSDDPLEATCFPADATVTLAGGEARRMDELYTGAEVQVGFRKTGAVIAWTHRDPNYVSGSFIRITAGGRTLTVTPGHYVYANARAVTALEVQKGDYMHGSQGELLLVTMVERVMAKGLYNPQTSHGDIAVNGFLVSTYTSTIKPSVAHAFLTPLRACYAAARAIFEPILYSK